MCQIATQIMTVEMKIAQAIENEAPKGELDVLRHELEALEKQYDEKYNGNKDEPWHGSDDLAMIGQIIIDAGKK